MNRNNMKRNKRSTESTNSITFSLRSVVVILSLNNLIPSGHALQASSSFTTGIRYQSFVPHSSPSIIRAVSSHSNKYYNTRNNLNMHLGHSHSHHEHEYHHHHHHDNHGDSSSGTTTVLSKMMTTCTNKRTLSRLAFSALVSLLLPLLLRRTGKVASFVASSTVLFLLDQIQTKVTSVIRRTKNVCNKMSQSSSVSSSTTATADRLAADKVTFLGMLVNLLLSIGKAIVGVKCHSAALVADAGHSFSDLFSDFITLGAVRIGRLPADEDHPYGHGKFEAIGSLFLSLTLLGTGLSVGLVSTRRLVEMFSASASANTVNSIPTFPAGPETPAMGSERNLDFPKSTKWARNPEWDSLSTCGKNKNLNSANTRNQILPPRNDRCLCQLAYKCGVDTKLSPDLGEWNPW